MGSPISMDLRERVMADFREDVGPTELARRYRLSESWVYKFLARHRATGSIEPPKGKKRGPKHKLAAKAVRIRELVEKRPDATLEELRKKLRVKVDVSTICRMLQSMKLTLKTSPARSRATPS